MHVQSLQKHDFVDTITIISNSIAEVTNALFDITLSIPKKSSSLQIGKPLFASIELTNFGTAGKTDVSLTYIVTNSKGDVVFLEREDKEVWTQISFMKELVLPELPPGHYKLLAVLLYSNTSASATGEFDILYFR